MRRTGVVEPVRGDSPCVILSHLLGSSRYGTIGAVAVTIRTPQSLDVRLMPTGGGHAIVAEVEPAGSALSRAGTLRTTAVVAAVAMATTAAVTTRRPDFPTDMRKATARGAIAGRQLTHRRPRLQG